MAIFKCLLYIYITVNGLTLVISGYIPCQGMDYKFDGYTYMLDVETGIKQWTHCSFPHPKADHTLCGRPEKIGEYYLCDPDQLLHHTIASNIDSKLEELQTATSTICINSDGEHQSVITAIAIVDHLLIPDFQSPTLCTTDCGKLIPNMNTTGRDVTYNEKRKIMDIFATNLRKTWRFGSCDNDVIILYCKAFNMVKVVAGSRTSGMLKDGAINELQETFEVDIRQYGFQHGFEQAVLTMLAKMRHTLRGVTPGHIIMYICIFSLLVGGVLLFLYVFIRDVHTDVWNEYTGWDVLDLILEIVTGVILVKGTIQGIAKISHSQGHGLYWLLGAGIFLFLVCAGLYVTSSSIYKQF
ncbi:hypothetical protein ACF0H5_017845 [Mactra antiquata]